MIAGLPVAAAVIEMVCGDAASEFEQLVVDGRSSSRDEIARVTAPTRLLLTAERTALNLLCHLSGVATLTRRWVDALEGRAPRSSRHPQDDARPPSLEKYAVRCGGGSTTAWACTTWRW